MSGQSSILSARELGTPAARVETPCERWGTVGTEGSFDCARLSFGQSCFAQDDIFLSVIVQRGLLKGGGEAEVIAAGWGNGGGGEEAGEVEDVEAVVEVLSVGLQVDGALFFLVELSASREIDRKRRLDAAVIEIDTVDHLLSEGGDSLIVGACEFDGQATAIFGAGGEPKACG